MTGADNGFNDRNDENAGGSESLALSPDGRCFATAADNGDIALWDAQIGTHIATLEYAGGIYSLEFLADGQLASGNEPSLWERVFIISAISKSGRASSSYTDYDAFVMLGRVHLPDDGPKFYLDLNIHDFNRLCLKPIKYFKQLAWRVSGVLVDILLLPDSTTVGDEEKLCN